MSTGGGGYKPPTGQQPSQRDPFDAFDLLHGQPPQQQQQQQQQNPFPTNSFAPTSAAPAANPFASFAPTPASGITAGFAPSQAPTTGAFPPPTVSNTFGGFPGPSSTAPPGNRNNITGTTTTAGNGFDFAPTASSVSKAAPANPFDSFAPSTSVPKTAPINPYVTVSSTSTGIGNGGAAVTGVGFAPTKSPSKGGGTPLLQPPERVPIPRGRSTLGNTSSPFDSFATQSTPATVPFSVPIPVQPTKPNPLDLFHTSATTVSDKSSVSSSVVTAQSKSSPFDVFTPTTDKPITQSRSAASLLDDLYPPQQPPPAVNSNSSPFDVFESSKPPQPFAATFPVAGSTGAIHTSSSSSSSDPFGSTFLTPSSTSDRGNPTVAFPPTDGLIPANTNFTSSTTHQPQQQQQQQQQQQSTTITSQSSSNNFVPPPFRRISSNEEREQSKAFNICTTRKAPKHIKSAPGNPLANPTGPLSVHVPGQLPRRKRAESGVESSNASLYKSASEGMGGMVMQFEGILSQKKYTKVSDRGPGFVPTWNRPQFADLFTKGMYYCNPNPTVIPTLLLGLWLSYTDQT